MSTTTSQLGQESRSNNSYLNTLDERWNSAILEWAIPESVLSNFKASPFQLDPSTFSPTETPAQDRRLEIVLETLNLSTSDHPKKSKSPTLIDVGAGAGSSLAPIREPFSHVTCIEGAPHMAHALAENLRDMYPDPSMYTVVEGRFPEISKMVEPATVVNCSNVIYNVTNPVEFLQTLDSLATDLVIVEATLRHPFYRTNFAFEHFWSLVRPTTPTISDVFEIATALGYRPRLESLEPTHQRGHMSLEGMAQRLGLTEERIVELKQYLDNNPMPDNPSALIWWQRR